MNENKHSSRHSREGGNPGIAAELDIAPIWDARNELTRLRGIVGALSYLTNPDRRREDDCADIFFEAFLDLEERLDTLAETIDTALKGMKIRKEAREG